MLQYQASELLVARQLQRAAGTFIQMALALRTATFARRPCPLAGVWEFFYGDHNLEKVFLELYGPVVIDNASPLSLGAEVGSNNTGELSAIGEALLWLRDEAPSPRSAPAVIHYDSEYAANITTRRNRAHKNQDLAAKVSALWDEVGMQRALELVHVKGHSGNPGNELADQLADKGAQGLHSVSSLRWSSSQALATLSASSPTGALAAARSTLEQGFRPAADIPTRPVESNPYMQLYAKATSVASRVPLVAQPPVAIRSQAYASETAAVGVHRALETRAAPNPYMQSYGQPLSSAGVQMHMQRHTVPGPGTNPYMQAYGQSLSVSAPALGVQAPTQTLVSQARVAEEDRQTLSAASALRVPSPAAALLSASASEIPAPRRLLMKRLSDEGEPAAKHRRLSTEGTCQQFLRSSSQASLLRDDHSIFDVSTQASVAPIRVD